MLGYLTSTLEVAREYLPKAQVQFVHPLRSMTQVNGGTLCDRALDAQSLFRVGRAFVDGHYPDLKGSVTFLTDNSGEPMPVIDQDGIAQALQTLSPAMRERLENSGKHRTADHLRYVAAHLIMHDTIGGLANPGDDSTEPAPINSDRVISVGAQSERPFYEARMACRREGVEISGMLEATGQLFTRHVLPPYLPCREGEPLLNAHHPGRVGMGDGHPVPSVQRDLTYLQQLLRGQLNA